MKPNQNIYPPVSAPPHSHAIADIAGLQRLLNNPVFGDDIVARGASARKAHFGVSGSGTMYIGRNVSVSGTLDDTAASAWRIAMSNTDDTIRFDHSPSGSWVPTTFFSINNAGICTYANLAGTGTRMVVASATGVLSTQAIPSGGGGITRTVATVTTTVTLGATALTDYVTFIGAAGVVALPTAVGNTNRYTLKNVDTTSKTVSTTSSQTIDGSTTVTLTPNTSLDVVSDGANWRII